MSKISLQDDPGAYIVVQVTVSSIINKIGWGRGDYTVLDVKSP
jgi:hypothetical protein